MRALFAVGLFGSLAVAAGCGGPPELGAPPNYAPRSMEQTAAQFHADPKSNRELAGDKVPMKFTDTEGKPVDLMSYRGKSNVVLVVVKGLPKSPGGAFCPGCLAQVNALTANYAEFKARDAEVLLVFPGPTDGLTKFFADAKVDGAGGNPKVPFAVLTDTDLNAVKSLGIDGDWAKPSTYILDKKGNAVFAFVGTSTTDRPSVKALLAQLDKVNGKK